MKAKVKVTISYSAAEMGILMHALRYGVSSDSEKLADSIDQTIFAAAYDVANAHNRKNNKLPQKGS